jgi:ABC-type transporter Mla subunit MlaD
MLLNELIRRLRDSDPQVVYTITFLYEAFNEQQKQLDTLTSTIELLAQMNDAFMKRDAAFEAKLNMLRSFGSTEGVEVSSVAPDPEDR